MSKAGKKWMRNKKERIYKRHNGHCHYCSRICKPFGSNNPGTRADDIATLDHVQTQMNGGGNADQNLVLACHKCNNDRSCIPYHIFLNQRLWLKENQHRCRQLARLFAIGGETVKSEKANVWLLEMYNEPEDEPIRVQNWGVFSSAAKVHEYMARFFPDAINNNDDELGYIGYHFKESHVLADTSFVANSWDLQ